jgi:hypothetical protein
MSTSLSALSRRIDQQMDQIRRAPSHFSKTPLIFSNIKLRHLKLDGKLEDGELSL